MTTARPAIWCWHVHHRDRLLDPLLGSLRVRQSYIRTYKPAHEVPIRLRLMRPVKGQIPAALIVAGVAWRRAADAYHEVDAAYRKAPTGAAWRKAGVAWSKAEAAYERAYKAALPELEALHAEECRNCTWNGETILPQQAEEAVL